jgi:hypothetical protein
MCRGGGQVSESFVIIFWMLVVSLGFESLVNVIETIERIGKWLR